MARYKQKPDVEPNVVWVVNPDGAVTDVTDAMPQAEFARANGGRGTRGWSLATEDQIKAELAVRKAKDAKLQERQARVQAAKRMAATMAEAGTELVKEEKGAPSAPSPRQKGA